MVNRITDDAYDCGQVSELLPMYVNGRLEAEDVVKVAAHLMTCAECRRELALLARLRSDVKKAEGEKSGEILASAFDLVRNEAENVPRKKRYLPEIAQTQCIMDARENLEFTARVVKKTVELPGQLLGKLLA